VTCITELGRSEATATPRPYIVAEQRLRDRLCLLRGQPSAAIHPARDLRWLMVLASAFGHRSYLVETAAAGDNTFAQLPLCLVYSRLFGRMLVSLPYVNYGGCDEPSEPVRASLTDRAVQLADELHCRHLELRHERPCLHSALTAELTSKSHMRLSLPETPGRLWDSFKSKVRNQVRKGQKQSFSVAWGGEELLEGFYAVFSRNMRDLGTPVYGRRLFKSILEWFGDSAEFCVVRDGQNPIAGALLLHGNGITEVPSASSLQAYNKTNANMLMYWHLLERAVERGQEIFDFGRSTTDGPTYRFKKQWGAEPTPAVWQYYVRTGDVAAMRRESARFQRLIWAWKKLPLFLANCLGPQIVRGIP